MSQQRSCQDETFGRERDCARYRLNPTPRAVVKPSQTTTKHARCPAGACSTRPRTLAMVVIPHNSPCGTGSAGNPAHQSGDRSMFFHQHPLINQGVQQLSQRPRGASLKFNTGAPWSSRHSGSVRCLRLEARPPGPRPASINSVPPSNRCGQGSVVHSRPNQLQQRRVLPPSLGTTSANLVVKQKPTKLSSLCYLRALVFTKRAERSQNLTDCLTKSWLDNSQPKPQSHHEHDQIQIVMISKHKS